MVQRYLKPSRIPILAAFWAVIAGNEFGFPVGNSCKKAYV
jgi:hypothetical protein